VAFRKDNNELEELLRGLNSEQVGVDQPYSVNVSEGLLDGLIMGLEVEVTKPTREMIGLSWLEKRERLRREARLLRKAQGKTRKWKKRPGPKYLHHTVRKARQKARMRKYYVEQIVFDRMGRTIWERLQASCREQGIKTLFTEEDLKELIVGYEDLSSLYMERIDKGKQEVTLEDIVLRSARKGTVLHDGTEYRMRNLGYII
jgi:hypothetical protein